MQTYNRNDDTRNYLELHEILGIENPKDADKPLSFRDDPAKINTPLVLNILERLSPGISRMITETINADPELSERMQRGETDLIDVYQMLENTARPQVAPTARTANNLGSAGFNAHTLSDEEFERIRQLTRNGHNVRI